jgi:calcium-dependent protein kinase
MKAIQYMHSKNIVHRDIKPENLLFVKPGSNHLKLIDFGISKIFCPDGDANSAIKLHTKAGSLFYISPEVLEGNYDQSCDIWSAGVILHLLLLGIPPFFDEKDSEVINKIKSEEIDTSIPGWENLSPDSKDLIQKMIVKRSKRISAKEIMDHPWMKREIKPMTSKIDSKSLIQFYKYDRLKRLALTALAFQLSDKDLEELARIFTKLDSDGDGKLSYNELTIGLEQLGPAYKEVLEAYKKCLNPNEKIHYNEFIASTLETMNKFSGEMSLKSAFASLDKNGDGKITASELRDMLGSYDQYKNKPASFWEGMIKEADTNGDGEVIVRLSRSIMTNL